MVANVAQYDAVEAERREFQKRREFSHRLFEKSEKLNCKETLRRLDIIRRGLVIQGET